MRRGVWVCVCVREREREREYRDIGEVFHVFYWTKECFEVMLYFVASDWEVLCRICTKP